MKLKQLPFFILLLLCLRGFSQKGNPDIVTTVQAGLLEGEEESAFDLKVISSLQHNGGSIGIGTGLDYYHVRSIPVFLDLRKAIGKGKQRPFVYGEGGYHFPWLTTAEKLMDAFKAKGGLYYDAGVGYEFPVMKQSQLFFSAGFSYKGYKSSYEYVICPFVGPCFTQTGTQVYRLRRLAIQTGLRF